MKNICKFIFAVGIALWFGIAVFPAAVGFAGWTEVPTGTATEDGQVIKWDEATKQFVFGPLVDIEGSTAAGQLLFGDSGGGWDHTETSELYWDDANKGFVIGETASDTSLTIRPPSGGGIKLCESDGTVQAVRITAYDSYGEINIYQTGTKKHIIPGIGEVVFNEIGTNTDFRIESDVSDAFFLRGSDGNIGISTNSPDARLESLDTSGAQLRLAETDSVNYADFTVDSSGKLTIAPSGESVVFSQGASSKPGVAFGDGDSGFYEYTDDSIATSIAGTFKYTFNSNAFSALFGPTGAGSLLAEASTSTNPTVAPWLPDSDTGVGWAGADQLSLIAGGVEGARIEETQATFSGSISGSELSTDPSDPAEGKYVMWQSDGTGTGDDGDILIKITAGGATKTATLVDFSSLP